MTDISTQADLAAVVASATRARDLSSPEAMLTSYMMTNDAPKDRHLRSYLRVFQSVIDLGHGEWPKSLREQVRGKDILDFGCGATLFGPAFRALGARSYTGIDKVIDVTKKRMRSRRVKQSVPTDISLAYAMEAIPNLSYVPGDDITSRDAFDLILFSSVTHVLPQFEQIMAHAARALRPGGQIWISHDNFYSWAGHLQQPKAPASYNPEDPGQKQYVDWGHATFEAPAGHPFHTLNRLRLGQLRSVLDRDFEVQGWKVIQDKSAMKARLKPEVRARLKGFSEDELLAKQVIIQARKR